MAGIHCGAECGAVVGVGRGDIERRAKGAGMRLLGNGLIPQIGGGAFSPSDVAGLVWWLDASKSALFQDVGRATLATSDGDLVWSFSDLSSSSLHAAAPGSGNRPVLKTNQLNGKSILRFDGTDDRLLTTGVATTRTDNFALFCVSKAGSTQANRSEVYIGEGNDGYGIMQSTISVKKGALLGNIGYIESATAAEATSYNVNLLRRSSGTARIYGNGALLAESTSSPIAPTVRMAIGDLYAGTYPTSCDIAEIVLFQDLSIFDANRIGAYLAAKWGLSWSSI